MVSTLTAMASVSGVSALATGETLSFGPKLTMVYRPNGAGKEKHGTRRIFDEIDDSDA